MSREEINEDSENFYLQPSRSNPSSGFSLTNNHIRSLDLIESPRNLQFDTSRPASSQETHSAFLISPATLTPAVYPSSPLTQYYSSSTSNLPQSHLESVRLERQQLQLQQQQQQQQQQQRHQLTPRNTPIVRIDPAQDDTSTTPSALPSISTTMSAVAVQFDSRHEMMGIPRSSMTWPGLDPSVDLLGHDLGPINYGSEASMTPPSTSRSDTSSPPRGMLTPEQRELKRQRDQARRDSKTSVRARRALSTASYSSASPPVTMADHFSSMPIYTTSPSHISLLTEPVTMSGSYMSSYSSSPLPESSALFTSPFPTLPSGGYMGLDYSPNFAPLPPSHSLTGHFSGRPASLSEPGMLYSIPPILPSGSNASQEVGHVRVVQSRPKPQCWEHGCNGRQFSTFSNLLRHQREKSGQASKASCPNCGAEFTRTTARNGHMLHDKCKSRGSS